MSKESARNLQENSVFKGSVAKNRSSIKIQENLEKPSSFKKKESQSVRNSFTQIVNPSFEKFLSKFNLNSNTMEIDTEEDSELLIVERLYREHKSIKKMTQHTKRTKII